MEKCASNQFACELQKQLSLKWIRLQIEKQTRKENGWFFFLLKLKRVLNLLEKILFARKQCSPFGSMFMPLLCSIAKGIFIRDTYLFRFRFIPMRWDAMCSLVYVHIWCGRWLVFFNPAILVLSISNGKWHAFGK